MKRLALVAVGLLGLSTAPAHAVTKSYSSGNINAAVGARLDQTLNVRDAGPVSFIRVSFRISVPDTSMLAVSLVSPRGTETPLVVRRGSGANFGGGEKSCDGIVSVFESDPTARPLSEADSPFTDNPYRAEGNLRSLYGEEARGRWALRIENSGSPATLHCFNLDLSRAVPETLSVRKGLIRAEVSFVETNYLYGQLRVKVVRAGRTAVDAPIQRLCRACNTFRPASVRLRDLDGGDPEILVDMYSGGAHCCSVVLVLRYEAAKKAYRSKLLDFGNYGYRVVDLGRDRLPELSAYDERFVYTFTPYVFSAAPIQIWRYRQGMLVDVTRSFPALVRGDAESLWNSYLKGRKEKDVDVRSYVAAYVAAQYLLDRPDEAERALRIALGRGDLTRGTPGWPAGPRFVSELKRLLRKWGYIRSP
jgi:subtilisin-like proprotein convertase family protein